MTATAEHAGIWLRVSTKLQDEASQVPDVAAWIGTHGYDTARTYTVHGGSAYKGNRKFDQAWASVLDDMSHGRITVLVVWKQDRLDRKLRTFQMLEQVLEAGGRVEFVTQPHLNDLTTMGGRIALKVQEEIAYAESKDKSDRIKAKQAGLRSRGALVGRTPWGYTSAGPKDNRRMITTAIGERYVPEIYTRIADGQTLDAVAAWLTAEGLGTWHPRVVAALVRNPSYRGEHRARLYDADGKQTSKYGQTIHQCPALVSSEVWRRAVASLDGRPSSRRGQRNDVTTGAALLSGLISCANPACTAGPDSPLYKIAPPGREPAYRCSGRGAARKGCGCNVPLADVDALIDEAMSQLRRPVMRPVFHPATGHQIAIDDITQALRDLPAQGLDEDAEDAERARLRAERRRLMDLPATPAWTEYVPVLDEAGEVLTHGARWARADQAERRAWLRDAGFAVYAGKPGMAPAEDEDAHPGESLSRTDVYASDTAVIVFRWTGDEDAGLVRGQVA
jgi:DNA invertase Pin-like site-specific DNA recombinase